MSASLADFRLLGYAAGTTKPDLLPNRPALTFNQTRNSDD